MNKPSKELVVDLINADTGRQFAYGEVTFDNPIERSIHGKNTEVVVRGVLEEGYTGAKVLHYDRLHLGTAMPPAEPEGVELMVPNDGFITTGEISERLNRMFGLALEPEDFVDVDLEISSLPMPLTLTANPNSLAWRGTMAISLVQDRPMFADAVIDPNLDGFETPNDDVSHLIDPAVTSGAHVTFRNGSMLAGFASVPSSTFTVCQNAEIEVSACARRLNGETAVDPSGDGSYGLALNGYATWCIPISIGLLDPQPGQRVTDLYDITLGITCPDNSLVSFKLERDPDDGTFYLTGSGATVIDIQHVTAQGDMVQHIFDMASISHLLGTIMTGPGGAPLGVYTVRLQARRRNSMAPRVLTTFLVLASNGT